MPTTSDRLLTTAQAAALLGITPGRVRQFILARRLPAEKVGRDLLIRERDLARVRHRRPGRPAGYQPARRDAFLAEHPYGEGASPEPARRLQPA